MSVNGFDNVTYSASGMPRVGKVTFGPPNPPWECPRCHQVNAWWVARCNCKPPKAGRL